MEPVSEAVELLDKTPEIGLDDVRTQLAKEAALVERFAAELKAGLLCPADLPALLENLGARLSMLAHPASPWRGIGRSRG